MTFLEEIRWRGLLQDMSQGLEDELKNNPMPVAYIGYDPTAPSMTIGNYVTIMLLKIFQKHGGKPIVVLGGATGRIGDPSGKDKERTLLDLEVLEKNLNHIKGQFQSYLKFDGPNAAEFVDNYDIYRNMDVFTFLRDIGKNITISYMMAKDSVQNRIEKGISFTEFSYQLLQGYDFVWLYQNKNCKIQMGGGDQWGNITSGTHLIGKMIDDAKGYAMTAPLLTNKEGKKFGKTEKGNVWLDRNLTSPYELYQFCLNQDDSDIIKQSRIFSEKPMEEIEALEKEHSENLGARILQKAFGIEIVETLHGAEAAKVVLEATDFLFSKKLNSENISSVSEEVWQIAKGECTSFTISAAALEEKPLSSLLTEEAPVFASKGEFKRAVQGNAVSINKAKVSNTEAILGKGSLMAGQFILVENGKTNKYVLIVNG